MWILDKIEITSLGFSTCGFYPICELSFSWGCPFSSRTTLCCFLVRREQRCLCSSTSFTGIRCLKRLSTIFMLRCCQEVDLTPLMLGTFAVKLAAPENVIRHTFVLTVTPLFTFYFIVFSCILVRGIWDDQDRVQRLSGGDSFGDMHSIWGLQVGWELGLLCSMEMKGGGLVSATAVSTPNLVVITEAVVARVVEKDQPSFIGEFIDAGHGDG